MVRINNKEVDIRDTYRKRNYFQYVIESSHEGYHPYSIEEVLTMYSFCKVGKKYQFLTYWPIDPEEK